MKISHREEAEVEEQLIRVLGEGHNQWTYRPDLKSEEDLWVNLRQKIISNNQAELNDSPLTDKEFETIKTELLLRTKTPFDAAKWLKGENGMARITIEREDSQLGSVSLILYSNQDIGGGISTYEVVHQIAKRGSNIEARDRRFDVTLLINGLPIVQIELKQVRGCGHNPGRKNKLRRNVRVFSHKERVRAIQLFLKYDCSYAATIRELGYPSIGALRKWYKEYLESGELHQEHRKKSKYSEEQKRIAVNHYFEYGQCYARTIRMLGYPNRESLRQWCEELAPGARKLRKSAVKLTQDQKEAVLKKFYKPQTNRKNLAESEGISRVTLYQWKNTVLGKDFPLRMTLKNQEKQKELLLKEVEDLQKQVHQLQLEKALLEGAAELLKKEKGVNLLCLSNQEKTILIDALRNQFTLKELLQQLQLPKSSYFYQKQALEKPDKYYKERQLIITIFNHNFCAYGYRRIHQALKNMGKKLSEKVVRRLMTEENLFVKKVQKNIRTPFFL